MDAFWQLARWLLKYRSRLVAALFFAVLSAVFFGGGVGFALPILRNMMGKQGVTFREYVAGLDETHLRGWVPDWFIEVLPTDRFGGFIWLVGCVLTMSVLSAVCRFLHGYLSMGACVMAVNDIRVAVFTRMVHLPLLSMLGDPATEKVSRIMRDSDRLQRGFTAIVAKSIGELLKAGAALTVALIADFQLALAAITTIPVMWYVGRMYGKGIRRFSRRASAEAARMMATITQSMQGLRVVKVNNGERYEVGRMRRVQARLRAQEMPLRTLKAAASPTVETIGAFVFGAVVIWAGWRITEGSTDGGRVLTMLLALAMASMRIKPLTYLANELQESSASADRLMEMFNYPPEVDRKKRLPVLARICESLEFDRVQFGYPLSERLVIEGVTLRIPKGSTTAFVGPNGCGKTTLLSMVPRLFDPGSGCVRVDGVDIRERSMHSLRAQIAVVTQETVLFHDTIANNIGYGRSGATRVEIEQAARRALAAGFIAGKPQGYDTMVGDMGLTLSGGERQRVAIARAILRDPAILILDEATSMIDAESEATITAALSEFCKGRTSLVIAHRLSTVIGADRIVVMDQGRIVDLGTHHELLERCVLYQQLCRTQLVSGRRERPASVNGEIGGGGIVKPGVEGERSIAGEDEREDVERVEAMDF